MEKLKHDGTISLKGALEALLLVSPDAVSALDLAKTLGRKPGEVVEALADLSAEYADAERGIQLREVAGGWRLFTHPAYYDQVAAYVISWDRTRLSQAALETLAVIAYHQPVTREGVRAVRGVNSDGVIGSLVQKGLVRELGRDRDHGQAILYGTTNAFLERFGLRSLRELPPLEDFAPDEESQRFIRERLSGMTISSELDKVSDDIADERELMGDDYDIPGSSGVPEPGDDLESSEAPAPFDTPQPGDDLEPGDTPEPDDDLEPDDTPEPKGQGFLAPDSAAKLQETEV